MIVLIGLLIGNYLKHTHHCAQIAACDTRQMFKLVSRLTVYKIAKALPSSHSSKKDLANRFSKFFDQKIKKIRNLLDDMSVKATPMTDINVDIACQTSFEHFEPLSCDAVPDIIKKSRVKSRPLDPQPAGITKEYLPEPLPSIALIVNTSSQPQRSACYPFAQKGQSRRRRLKELSSCI